MVVEVWLEEGGETWEAGPFSSVCISQAELAALTNNSQCPAASSNRSSLPLNVNLQALAFRTASV